MKIYLLLLFLGSSKAQDIWPDCVVDHIDYTGDDIIKGLRFSTEECALWCKKISLCERWVYVEKGPACHVKAYHGNPRNISNPLTKEDEEEFAEIETESPIIDSNSTNSTSDARKRRDIDETTASPSPKEIRIQERIAELLVTHTGESTCYPKEKVQWNACVNKDKTLNASSAPGEIIANMDLVDCSYECYSSDSCDDWLWNAQTRTCSLFTGEVNQDDLKHSYNGEKACFGKVEVIDPNKESVDGNWSPWSTLATPCFEERTGQTVQCGGGVQYRYRSCSNPHARNGGQKCLGDDLDKYPCNLNSCPLPSEFLWSEWGPPDVICGNGTQKKTTMCGDLRRRLPLIEETDELPVYWPSCLSDKFNEATSNDIEGQTMDSCMTECSTDPNCRFWTFNKTSDTCHLSKLMKIVHDISGPQYVSGNKECRSSTLYFPHCGQINKNFTDLQALNMTDENNMTSIKDCIEACQNNPECLSYLVKTDPSVQNLMDCQHWDGPISTLLYQDITDVDFTYVWANSECQLAVDDIPVIPEDAQELSYKETCRKEQYQEKTKVNNTWNRDYCPSPCEQNGPCPSGSQCIDLSNDLAPNHTCECRMGLVMEDGRCIAKPPTTPVSLVIVTLAPAEKETTAFVTKSASFVLIGFLTATLVIFALGRIFNHGRFIHMNIEVALLLAHCCLLPDMTGGDPVYCRLISIFIHFFYTVVFAFFALEAMYMYSILANVVRQNGMLSHTGNFVIGWGCGIVVIAFSCSFEYDNYGGEYQ